MNNDDLIGKQFQIVIEGSCYSEVNHLFEEIQNKYSLYDNCIFQIVDKKDSIVDTYRGESGFLHWSRKGSTNKVLLYTSDIDGLSNDE